MADIVGAAKGATSTVEVPKTSQILMSKAQEAVKKRLEEYNTKIEETGKQEPVSTLPNPVPGSEPLESRFEKPDFSDVAGRRTRVRSGVGVAGWGLGADYPGLATYAPGTRYLGNKELYHAARSRLRYSRKTKDQVSPLRRGTE